LQENALKAREKFGGEKAADVMWEMLCEKFPHLIEKYKEECKEER